jgi:hypothetical protein
MGGNRNGHSRNKCIPAHRSSRRDEGYGRVGKADRAGGISSRQARAGEAECGVGGVDV